MEQQNRKLLDARKTGYATVELAAGTNAELARQTETLSRNKDRVIIWPCKFANIMCIAKTNEWRLGRVERTDKFNAASCKKKQNDLVWCSGYHCACGYLDRLVIFIEGLGMNVIAVFKENVSIVHITVLVFACSVSGRAI